MTTTTTPRIGLIGCGAIAERYHLPALAEHSQLRGRLVLADTNLDRLAEMADTFGVESTIGDFRDLADKVDGVVIATPPASHHPIAMHFLKRGVAVLCEKPLAETSAEAQEMVATAKQNGVALLVNHTRRLFPTYGKIRELIAQGVLGDLRSVVYRDGVEFDWPAASPFHFIPGAKGTLSDTGIHLIDTVCWWIDAMPTLVSSRNDSFGGPEAVATLELKHLNCDIELMVSRLGRLPNGFRIEGTEGIIEAQAEDWNEITVQFHTGRRQRFSMRGKAKTYTDFARPLIDNFVNVIASGAEPLISGESVLPAVELLEMAYEHAEQYDMPWNKELRSIHVA